MQRHDFDAKIALNLYFLLQKEISQIKIKLLIEMHEKTNQTKLSKKVVPWLSKLLILLNHPRGYFKLSLK